VKYEPPKDIIRRLEKLEAEIQSGITALKESLR
jgi:hypothetical protein